MTEAFDVFLSHAWGDHLDAERVRARPARSGARQLRDALRARGLRVFFDEGSIDDFAPLADTIVAGLRASKVLVAWCSDLYLTRPACASELTRAMTWSVGRSEPRVLVVNTEVAVDHLPSTLRANLVRSAPDPDDAAGFDALVDAIIARCGAADGTLGDRAHTDPAQWFPERIESSTRFTGRFHELWELHGILTRTALHDRKDSRRGAVVSGMGGSGKSLLAIEYAHRFAAAWPGGVVFLTGHGADREGGRLSSADRAAAAIRELAEIDLRIKLPAGAGLGETREAIGRWFDGRGATLWIVDDLAQGAEVAAWTAPMVDGATVLTTRVRSYDGVFEPLWLDSLSPDDAYALLIRDAPPVAASEQDAARTITERLGRNALAIDVTRTRVRDADDYGNVLARLDADTLTTVERAGARVGALAGDHTASITATLERSVVELTDLGRGVLRAAACFESVPIPDDTLAGVLADRDALGSGVIEDIDDLEDGVHDLLNQSLVRRNERTIIVHRLVVDLARPADDETRTRVLARAERVLCDALDDVDDERALRSRRAHHELATTIDVGPESDLPIWMARYEIGVGAPRAAVEHLERLVAVRSDRPDEHRAATLEAVHELAEAYVEAGDNARAIELHGENFVEREELLGPTHPDTLESAHGLAVARFWSEEECRELLEATWKLRSDVLGEWHEDTLMTLHYLARACVADDDIEDGIELLEATLEGQVAVLGGDHVDTLDTEIFLAEAYQHLGDLDVAVAGYEHVIDAATAAFGETHRSVLATMTLLADALNQRGESERAVELATAAAVASERAMGLDHPYTHQAFDQLADLHLDADDPSAALAALDATAGYRVAEPGNPETLRWRRMRAETLHRVGEPAAAIDVYEALLDEMVEFYDARDDRIREIRADLAELRRARGGR